MSSGYVPITLKQLVFDRARGLCEYCRSQAKYASNPLVIDHIQPVSRGGQTQADSIIEITNLDNDPHASVKLEN